MAKADVQSDQKISKWLSGVAGEYFVAAELSRRGFIAAITLRNSRGIDIIVSRDGGTRSATVQVKTLQVGTVEWLLSKEDETPKQENHFYVLVALNGQNGRVEYHVVPGGIIASECTANHKNYLKTTKKDGTPRKDTTMRVFQPGKRFRDEWQALIAYTG